MHKTIIILMLFLIAGTAYSQTISITDAEDNQPLEMVSISSEAPREFTTTNTDGRAEIGNFRGAEDILIHLMGYLPQRFSFTELEAMDFTLELQSDPVSLDQAIVSASRWSQPKKEVPAKVTVLTPKDIALQNPQTAADLLGSSGEVFIQKSQLGGGSPMIRGFSTNRLLLTIDGVRMNTAIFRAGNLQNVISIDPFAVQSTEVLFGPGSVIYGSDAIGGVMSFHTLTPMLSFTDEMKISGRAVTRYASASNERTTHFDVNLGWRKWASVSSFTYTQFDHLRMGTNGPDEYLRDFYVRRIDSTDVVVANEDPLIQRPTGYSQYNLMQKLRYRPNNRWDFTYGFHYSTTTEYARYDRLIEVENDEPKSAEWNYGPQKWLMHNFNISHTGDNFFYDNLSLRAAYQFFEESRISRDFRSVMRETTLEQVDAWSLNLDFEKILNEDHKIYYGAEWISNDVLSDGNLSNINNGISFNAKSRYPHANWSSYAGYMTYQWDISDEFLIQGGGRYNHFTLDADFSNNLEYFPFGFRTANLSSGSFTGSIGFAWNPTPDWSISGNASTGFRAPNVDDVGKVFDSEPGSVVVPNPDLTAEYAYNVEASISKLFYSTVKLELTGFYTLLDNAMVRRDFQLNGQDSIMYSGELSQVQAIQNAASTTVYGIQAGLDIKLPEGFSFSSQYNYQKGMDELQNGEDSPSRHAAPWFGVSRLKFSKNKLDLQFYTMYSGEVKHEDMPAEEVGKTNIYATDANGNSWSPGWYTLNFKADYQLNEILSIGAGLENITDQRYRPYSSGLVAAGRNLIMSLRAEF